MKPSGWFSSSSATTSSSGWTQSVADTGRGLGNQFKTMGTTMTSAMGKAKDAVVSTFTPKPDGELDPQTSLAKMPDRNALGAEIWVANGQVYEMKGNYTAAMNEYSKALEKEPDNLAALQSVARLHLRQNEYTQAIDGYQKVIRVSPTAENYTELGAAQQKAGKLSEAQASIQQAIQLDPNTQRYRNNLAGVLVALGRSDEAVSQLQQVFTPAEANYNVAYLHFMNKNTAAAQQHLQVALQADPNMKKARDLLNTLTQSQTGQAAVAAYGVANQFYQASHTTQPPAQSQPANSQFSGSAPTFQSQLPNLPTVNR